METLSVQFTPQDFAKVDTYFQSYTGVDLPDIPEKYDDYILKTRTIMAQDAQVNIKYGDVGILSNVNGQITLENGDVLDGKLVAKAYEGLSRMTMFVASVVNIDQILQENDDMMDQFFLEFWAVSMLNAGREILTAQCNQTLAAQGETCTSVWSPGQGNFKLTNQKVLFHLLAPETMGVTLDKRNRILPLKSVSGTMGHMKLTQEEEIISCDYCEFRETCPGYAGKKYEHLQSQRRLL